MAKTKTKGTAKTVSDTPVPQPITIRSTNPKIMADNILKLEESIKAADVSANPTGEAEETLLSTIGIDGKKYELGPSAENTSYNNTDSGLTATDTQAAIDEVNGKIKSWTLIASDITSTSDPIDIADYSELYIIPKAQGIGKSAPLYCPNFNTFTMANSYREGTTYSLDYAVSVSDDSLTVAYNITGWTSVTFDIYGK